MNIVKKTIFFLCVIYHKLCNKSASYGKNCIVFPSVQILGGVRICNNVFIDKSSRLNAFDNGELIVNEDCSIGRRSTIDALHSVILQKGVLLGPNVYISDMQHNYESIDSYIRQQGLSSRGSIVVVEGSWLGTNAVVMGNVKIGKHCVVGANTVVTKDIPDYCVVVGNPAKIVKKFDAISCSWINL